MIVEAVPALPHRYIRELKRQRRRRLPKRHLKSEVALLQTLSYRIQFVNSWHFFLELSSKGCIEVQKKKKKVVALCSRITTKREIRHFHVVVVQ